MGAKLTRLTHRIAIQLHLVAESCTICSSYSRWPVQKLLDTPFYVEGTSVNWNNPSGQSDSCDDDVYWSTQVWKQSWNVEC